MPGGNVFAANQNEDGGTMILISDFQQKTDVCGKGRGPQKEALDNIRFY